MGYDLHITRRKHWPDKGNDISAEEWLSIVNQDQELTLKLENGPYFVEWTKSSDNSWLDWLDGQIYAKNPSEKLIDKMVSIAEQLSASVQGDDGERYIGGSEPAQELRVTFADRIALWISRLRLQKKMKIEHEPLPFGVGDKVCDIFGNVHTVIEIDPKANHSMGAIRTRRSDGTSHTHALIAHGFQALEKE